MLQLSNLFFLRDNVSIPVFANGNIQYGTDIDKCIECTGVDGVMAAGKNIIAIALFYMINAVYQHKQLDLFGSITREWHLPSFDYVTCFLDKLNCL